MKAAVKARTISEGVLRFAVMAGLTLCVIGAMALNARAEEAPGGLETGSIKRDVVVEPVRRVFPKTPSDGDLNRLSRTAKANTKKRGKAKKR